MRARKTKVYTAISGPGADVQAAVPENPRRIALLIQNTGGAPGLQRFAGPTQGSGADLTYGAGDSFQWDQSDTCPQEAIFVGSDADTTWCIVETVSTS